MTPVQVWGNRLQTAAIRARYGLRLTDMGPMRAIRLSSLLALEMEDPTWGWNVEMACKAARHGLRVVEVPAEDLERAALAAPASGVDGAAPTRGQLRLDLTACEGLADTGQPDWQRGRVEAVC